MTIISWQDIEPEVFSIMTHDNDGESQSSLSSFMMMMVNPSDAGAVLSLASVSNSRMLKIVVPMLYGGNCLMLASLRGMDSVVEALVKAGEALDIRDRRGMMAIPRAGTLMS